VSTRVGVQDKLKWVVVRSVLYRVRIRIAQYQKCPIYFLYRHCRNHLIGALDFLANFDLFRGFEDETALEKASAGSSRIMDVLGGLQFHDAADWPADTFPSHLNYSVRIDPLRIPKTTEQRKTVERRWGEEGWFLYYFSAFSHMQVGGGGGGWRKVVSGGG